MKATMPDVPAPPVQLPIGECLYRTIECPQCGSPAYVEHSRGNRAATQVLTAAFWMRVICDGCGSSLRQVSTVVTVMPGAPSPQPAVFEPLNRALGKWVKCTREHCDVRARAGWSRERLHEIQCPVHGSFGMPPDTQVEILGIA
jgi:hypothetical protein